MSQMSESTKEPSGRKQNPIWIVALLMIIAVSEGVRYVRRVAKEDRDQTQPPPSRPAPPRPVHVDISDNRSRPQGETVSLSSNDPEGVWVCLMPSMFNDMSVYVSRGEKEQLRGMQSNLHADLVPNGTTATVLKGSVFGYHLELRDGQHSGQRVFVNPQFVHRPGEEKSNLDRTGGSPDAGRFTLEERDGKMILRPFKAPEE